MVICVDAALNTIIIADAYNVPVPMKESEEDTPDVESMSDDNHSVDENQQDTDLIQARTLFHKAMSSKLSAEQVCSEDVTPRILEIGRKEAHASHENVTDGGHTSISKSGTNWQLEITPPISA